MTSAPICRPYTAHITHIRQGRTHRREGNILLHTSSTKNDPAKLWNLYLLLVRVEEAFKNLKGDLAIDLPSRPGPDRSAYLHRLPGLLPARHSGATAACTGAGALPAQRHREVRGDADDRCARPDHRRPRIAAHPIYRTRCRAALTAR